ncbi:MAG: chorismate synthase [Rickettsiaceae bacterium H1]|nr:chorismate synthase [Rickettsiaceae bacterium H1]
MAFNSFGNIFRYTSWGESHGKAIGGVIDGVPANILLHESDIQFYLDRRSPGQSAYTTGRKEADEVEILSGVFNEKTTGAPIGLIIYNKDHNSKDYSEIKDKFRPGHADFTYFKKYGNRDYRGGGRASARETAIRVAAGAIARKIIDKVTIKGAVIQIGEYKIKNFAWDEVNDNLFFCPDKEMKKIWSDYIIKTKEKVDSVGAVIEIHANNVPIGLGEPVYGKLDAAIAGAIMGINAVKGVEFGMGFESASMHGSNYVDEMIFEDNKVKFFSNNNSGILGGISTGQPIITRFVVKPTSSIKQNLRTMDIHNNNVEISTRGRHDPCIGIRAVPVGEAMVACVLADYYLANKAVGKK